jgi:hypothetical protein
MRIVLLTVLLHSLELGRDWEESVYSEIEGTFYPDIVY